MKTRKQRDAILFFGTTSGVALNLTLLLAGGGAKMPSSILSVLVLINQLNDRPANCL